MQDKEGLDEAYSSPKGTFVAGDSLYISGTKSAADVLDDVSIPLGLTSKTARYRDASLVLSKNPQVQRLVGHSLGGAVALELQKQKPDLQSVTYGAPVASTKPGERYRHWGDPVAALDSGAQTTAPTQVNPHSYAGLAARMHKFAPGSWRDGYLRHGVAHYFI